MLVLAIRYLNGWAMAAADGAHKERAEWPPHPDRVFMALAAAWFETGEAPAEGAALRWLEALPPPALHASEAEFRRGSSGSRPPVAYVPVNDTRLGRKAPATDDLAKLKEAGLGVLPQFRPRQPRSFPVAVPHHPVVQLIWPGAEPGDHRPALEALLAKVTHVGHSASFVQMWIEDSAPAATWEPTTGLADHRLRVPCAGRLEELRRRLNREAAIAYADLTAQAAQLKGKEKQRVTEILKQRFGDGAPLSLRPTPGRWQGYARPAPASDPHLPGTHFDPRLVVLAIKGRRLGLTATLQATEALRGAVMATCPVQPPPEWLCGHTADGAPSKLPHLALLPLPFAGSAHADGHLLGFALALPAGLDRDEAARCLSPLLLDQTTGERREIKLFDGRWLECTLALDTGESGHYNLRPEIWSGPGRIWATVTPIAFDRHGDGEAAWTLAAEGIKDACERIGLPRPAEVVLHPVSLIEGVPHAREFPRLIRKPDGGLRHHSHAVILFDQPVRGPVVVGAGRFRGYGLCRPLREGGHSG